MNQLTTDEFYMRRALGLAALGAGHASPNPMVGAVIVAGGRIIGQGWHRSFGGPHAEVQAVRSVREADRRLLPESTIYVTLEPCSHYGKTPPCAKLLIDERIRRVVIGAPDPNPLVSGRGVKMLREAGISVTEDVLCAECVDLNRRFMTAQVLKRPWVQLKYAVTPDGFMGAPGGKPLVISGPLSSVWMHRERSMADAILVGVNTVVSDSPRLSCRLWPGRDPLKVTFDSPRLPADCALLSSDHVLMGREESLPCFLHRLFEEKGVTSLMVEGGPATLSAFLAEGIADEVRVETGLDPLSPEADAPRAPRLPDWLGLAESYLCQGRRIDIYRAPDKLSNLKNR